MPSKATLGSFMSKNMFDILGNDTTDTTTTRLLSQPEDSGCPARPAHNTTAPATLTNPVAQAINTTRHDTTRQTVADLQRRIVGCGASPPGLRTVTAPSPGLAAAVLDAEQIIESINVLEYSQPAQALCAVEPETVKVRVAMDSAASANVIKPDELPADAVYEPNEDDKHFVGANDSFIERYGSCKTIMSSPHGNVGCNWQMAAVSRALHSVGIVAGPKGGPGKQDILFNNEKCYVVAPGVVAKMMEKLTAVAEYDREGNLYIGEFSLSSFHRQGLNE